jgi:hypothetical protein
MKTNLAGNISKLTHIFVNIACIPHNKNVKMLIRCMQSQHFFFFLLLLPLLGPGSSERLWSSWGASESKKWSWVTQASLKLKWGLKRVFKTIYTRSACCSAGGVAASASAQVEEELQ